MRRRTHERFTRWEPERPHWPTTRRVWQPFHNPSITGGLNTEAALVAHGKFFISCDASQKELFAGHRGGRRRNRPRELPPVGRGARRSSCT